MVDPKHNDPRFGKDFEDPYKQDLPEDGGKADDFKIVKSPAQRGFAKKDGPVKPEEGVVTP